MPCVVAICRYRVDGSGGWETGYRWDPSRVLVDPYARHVAGRRQWATRDEFENFQTTVCVQGVREANLLGYCSSLPTSRHPSRILAFLFCLARH